MSAVEASDLPALNGFVRGLRKDLPAVTAGLSLPYSNGPTEGVNTKVKLIKRQMYGRAGFALLRRRILAQLTHHHLFCARAVGLTGPLGAGARGSVQGTFRNRRDAVSVGCRRCRCWARSCHGSGRGGRELEASPDDAYTMARYRAAAYAFPVDSVQR
jgi:hypothetical protein